MALYRLTGDDAQLVAKSGWPDEEAEKVTPFSPAQSTVPQNDRALFCAHHFFWILDAAQEQVMILPVPGLEDGSGSYCNSVFTDGKNVVYSIYHAGLPKRITEYRILPLGRSGAQRFADDFIGATVERCVISAHTAIANGSKKRKPLIPGKRRSNAKRGGRAPSSKSDHSCCPLQNSA